MSDLSKLMANWSNEYVATLLGEMANATGPMINTAQVALLREAASRLQAPAVAEVEERRCEYCDGTGDVIRIDGEWLGECDCGAAAPRTGGSE